MVQKLGGLVHPFYRHQSTCLSLELERQTVFGAIGDVLLILTLSAFVSGGKPIVPSRLQ